MLKSDENSESKEKSDLLQSSKKRKCKEMFLHLLQEQVHDNVELQQAVEKFKKTSEEEIKRIVKYEGVGIHDAIDAVVAKIRGAHGENFEANEEDVQLVMEVAWFHNKQDALRALIVREELVKLRKKGMEGVQAVDELVGRMKSLPSSLIGVKRERTSSGFLSQQEGSSDTENTFWNKKQKNNQTSWTTSCTPFFFSSVGKQETEEAEQPDDYSDEEPLNMTYSSSPRKRRKTNIVPFISNTNTITNPPLLYANENFSSWSTPTFAPQGSLLLMETSASAVSGTSSLPTLSGANVSSVDPSALLKKRLLSAPFETSTKKQKHQNT